MLVNHVHSLTDLARDDVVLDLLARTYTSKVLRSEIRANVDIELILRFIELGRCQFGVLEVLIVVVHRLLTTCTAS